MPKFGGKGMYGMNVHTSVVEAKEESEESDTQELFEEVDEAFEDDDDDDYEAPPLFDSEQERHDIALATTYCLGESFIDNDGDLDDIYYAVLKYFDSTYDAPETADYENVLQWCRKHYKQIESMIN